jgi:MFS family permease
MRWQYRHTVLALCTVAFFATMVARLAISPVVPAITDEFAVSNTLIGAALSGMWLAYALVQYPSGVLADRFGERRVVLASVGGTGLTSVVVVAAPQFAVFFVGVVLLGLATGLHFSVATTLITRTYDDLGTAIAIHNAGGPAAGLVTPVVVSWIGVRYGWRPAVAVAAAVAALVVVLFAYGVQPTAPRSPERPMREQFRLEPLLDVLSRASIAFTAVIAVVAEFAWTGLVSFLPTFLAEYRGYSATRAGLLFALYFVALGVLQVGVGAVADRYGRDVATGACMCAGIVGLSTLVFVPGSLAVAAGVLLAGLGMGWGAAVFPRFMDHLFETERGTGFGLVRTVYLVVASSGSITLGVLADRFGWAVSFGSLIASLAAVLCLLVGNWALGTEY